MDEVTGSEHPDINSEITLEAVKKKAVKGVIVLTGRMFLMQGVGLVAFALLPIFLTPAEIGIYFIVSAIKDQLSPFSDIGFAAALIQKKEQLKDIELNTIFTAQQVMILSLLTLILVSTPVVKNIFHFDQKAIYLLWALLFSLLFSSLKTIPSVLLERKLDFNKLVIPQIVENIIFYLVTIFLAWKGFGITSYTIAVLLSGTVGLVLMYIIKPWLPRIAFSVDAFKSILKYGIPYQLNTLLAKAKDDSMTFFLGIIIGPSNVGLLYWAKKWADAPLRFFMDQVIRVTFPAFSRLQDNKKELSDAVTKSIFFICLLVFPALVMLNFLAPTLVNIIPKYGKWSLALSALSILTIPAALGAITTPLTNTLNAIGKITLTFKLMMMWFVLTWIFIPVLAIVYGVNGGAIGFMIVGLSSFIALYFVSKYVDINYLQSVGKPMLASLLMALFVFAVKTFFPISVQQVVIMIIVGPTAYAIAMFIFEPKLILLMRNQLKKIL